MNLPEDYFRDTDEPMLTYLEEQAKATITSLVMSNTNNRQRAEKIMNYLLIGVSSLALLIINNTSILQAQPIKLGVIILIIGWSLAIGALICNVFKGFQYGLSTNAPENLYNETFKQADDPDKLQALRQMELLNYSDTIRELKTINRRFCRWTDIAMLIAILTPLLAVIVFVFYQL